MEAGLGLVVTAELHARLTTFSDLAGQLSMPLVERAGILGVADTDAADIAAAALALDAEQRRALHRRLLYIIPLMRRALSNSGSTDSGAA